jgi:hypothetical protein
VPSETIVQGNKFVGDRKNEMHQKEMWPHPAYGGKKIGVTVQNLYQETEKAEEKLQDPS